MTRRPPKSTLFPHTTLSGSGLEQGRGEKRNPCRVPLDAAGQPRGLGRVVARERPGDERLQRGAVEAPEPDDLAFQVAPEARSQVVQAPALGRAPGESEQQ